MPETPMRCGGGAQKFRSAVTCAVTAFQPRCAVLATVRAANTSMKVNILLSVSPLHLRADEEIQFCYCSLSERVLSR